ncbi:MAG: hypothetical protein QW063_00800 [Candidatus Nanoarchaeia archaeon]
MISEAKKDVLDALNEAIVAIKEKKHAELHAISDHVLHVMAIYQEPDIVDFSVAIYALDKILQTEKYRAHPKMKAFRKITLNLLKDAKAQLEKEAYNAYSARIKELLGVIQKFTKEIKFYIEDVLHFARIKKGTKLYEHGLSLGKAAEVAGVTKWELMPAIGETVIHEQLPVSPEQNLKRVCALRRLFKVKKKVSER